MPKSEDFVQNKFDLGDGKEMSIVLSNPPTGKCLVKNIFWDPVAQKIVIQFDNIPQP